MKNKEQYISISEFAERAGVNRSYIYKLLSTKLSTYCLQVDNQKKLNIKALELFNVEQVDNLVDKKETDGDTLKDLIEILQEQQKVLKQELDIKNEQIKSLSKTIENDQELIKREQEIVSQQQKLQAIAEQNRLQIEAHPQEITKQESLLNREKFSTEAEYSTYLVKLLPRIGLFSSRQDREELEKILELMSQEERKLIYQKKPYREAIEYIRKVDFDFLDKHEEDEEELNKFNKQMEDIKAEIFRQIKKEKGGI